jgi:hypothetical protein
VPDKVALRQVFLYVLQFSPAKSHSTAAAAHTFSFTCHQCRRVSVRYHQLHYNQSNFLKEEEEEKERHKQIKRKDTKKEKKKKEKYECLRKGYKF